MHNKMVTTCWFQKNLNSRLNKQHWNSTSLSFSPISWLLRFCISFLRSSGIEIRCCLTAWPAKTAGCTWNKRLEGGWNRGAAGKYARDKCAALCIYILPGRFMVERKQKYTRYTLAGMVEHSARLVRLVLWMRF